MTSFNVMTSFLIHFAIGCALFFAAVSAKGKTDKGGDDDPDESGDEPDVDCDDIKERLHWHGDCFDGSDIHTANLQIMSTDRVEANIKLIQMLLLIPNQDYDQQGLLDRFIEPYHYEWILYSEGFITDPIYNQEYVLVLLSKYESMDSCFLEHISDSSMDEGSIDNTRGEGHHATYNGSNFSHDFKLRSPFANGKDRIQKLVIQDADADLSNESLDDEPLIDPLTQSDIILGPNGPKIVPEYDRDGHMSEKDDWTKMIEEGLMEYLGIDFIGGQYYEIYDNNTAIMLEPVVIDIDRYEYIDVLARFEISESSEVRNKFYAETNHYWLTGRRSLIGRTFALYTVPNKIRNVTTHHDQTSFESTSSRHDDLVLRRSNRLGCGVVGYSSEFKVTGDKNDKYLPANGIIGRNGAAKSLAFIIFILMITKLILI